jgi:hypothetical protein
MQAGSLTPKNTVLELAAHGDLGMDDDGAVAIALARRQAAPQGEWASRPILFTLHEKRHFVVSFVVGFVDS